MSKGTRVTRRRFLGSAASVGAAVCSGAAMAEPQGQKKPRADSVEDFLKNRQSLATDPYRPLYHFSPPGFGTHDPAGLCWWKGQYHFFYLFSIPGVLWGRGHAVSDDLVHWRDMPMLPKEIHGGTGQVWAGEDQVIMGYVGAGHASACLATARDPLLVKWTKHPRNPIIKPGNDNFVWREGKFYYLTQRKHGDKTKLELFRSRDLTTWESMGMYFEDSHFTDPGTDCSCNNVLSIGNGKHPGPARTLGKLSWAVKRFVQESFV